ncbi:MAG: ABC transporter permease [Dehalococcoidia bacterium]|nr:ABC transporter permease [Dehalococcoidia bacterium]
MRDRLSEILRYRDLMWNLVARDLKVRYRSSVLGFFWSLLNPLLMTTVFYVVFNVLMRNSTEMFPVFILCGILPWNWCAASVTGSVGSIVGNGHLIKKIYFPRELLPASMVVSNLVNFILALPVLFLMMIIFGAPLTWFVLLLPVLILIQLAFLLGLSFFLSTVNVFFRDTSVIVEVVLLAWFFLTPVFYRIEDLTANWSRLMYILNPMASIISNYRLILYAGAAPAVDFMMRTAATSLIVLVVGYLIFARFSHLFGEEV